MTWIGGDQVRLLRRMAHAADRLSETAGEAARAMGHGDLWRASTALPPLVRASLLVIDAIELRLAAIERGDLGWFVAANAVLQGDFKAMASALRWQVEIGDDARLVALLYALRSPPTLDALEAAMREVMVATRRAQRASALDELTTCRVLSEVGGVLSWGPMAPQLPLC